MNAKYLRAISAGTSLLLPVALLTASGLHRAAEAYRRSGSPTRSPLRAFGLSR
jgi:hypothetical protein